MAGSGRAGVEQQVGHQTEEKGWDWVCSVDQEREKIGKWELLAEFACPPPPLQSIQDLACKYLWLFMYLLPLLLARRVRRQKRRSSTVTNGVFFRRKLPAGVGHRHWCVGGAPPSKCRVAGLLRSRLLPRTRSPPAVNRACASWNRICGFPAVAASEAPTRFFGIINDS